MPDARRPYCTILGGANGSGKSTLYRYLQPPGKFVNADNVARGLKPESPETVYLAAGRQVLMHLDHVIEARRDFVYETTLSSHQSVSLMARCRSVGYEVSLVFITLSSVDLNVRRVAERVAAGGHDIPENVVRRRYETAFSRLPSAIRLADRSLLFDNSAIEPAMLMSIEDRSVVENNLDDGNVLHIRFAEAVGMALQTSAALFLRAARHP